MEKGEDEAVLFAYGVERSATLAEFIDDPIGEKQEEVLDFVEFLTARQARKAWTTSERQSIVAQTMGCLAGSRTSSEAFAESKREEKATEHRRWK